MTNFQKIKAAAKKLNLTFVASGSSVNGAKLYNFKNEFNTVVASNWTIASASQELNHGDLESKLS